MNGSDLAGFIKERQAKQVRALRQAWGVYPRLAIVSDVNDPVVDLYVKLKQRYGADILIDVEVHNVSSADLSATIGELNGREDIQGIIVQLPVAVMSGVEAVLGTIAADKDVDSLGPDSPYDAATPVAINWLLSGYGVELAGKKVAIVGRGRLVGRPLEVMWVNSGYDVTVFELGDDLSNLAKYDVVVAAAGAGHIITSEMIKPGAVVVDAGTSSEEGVVRGDVAPDVRSRNDVSITPEKGGVGPLTVAALFDNLINACLKIANSDRSAV